jgi:valyl-tRNA synthetase
MLEKYDHKIIENKWLPYWNDEKIYSWDKTRSRSETFVVDTPPPTVSGSLHLGHFFSYTQTDLIVRFWRMNGKNIFYPLGWDDNGLPTERRVQNVYNVQCDINEKYLEDLKVQKVEDQTSKQKDKQPQSQLLKVSRKNFIELCSRLTLEDEIVFKELFTKLGLSVDWDLEYATINSWCRKVSQLSFIDLFEKKQVYTLESPTLWDVTFQTAVATAEVEDRPTPGFYYDLKFQTEKGDEFVISTTRPELLPACIAVVAHPKDPRFSHLFNQYAVTPLFKAKVPIMASEHADPEKGSGILMVCTFGDSADVDWWKMNKHLPLRQILDSQGHFKKVTFGEGGFDSIDIKVANENYEKLVGLHLNKAKKVLLELLAPFIASEPRPTTRFVKYFEKGDKPLEYLTSRQWYVKILDHKEELLKQGDKINWVPEHMKHRYTDWVKNLNQDWCISRQRYFGIPFPVWYPLDENKIPQYDRPIIPNKQNFVEVDPVVDAPYGYNENQRGKAGGFIGDKDVMDTWATSSLTPQISSHFNFDDSRHEKLFPMDMRPQSHEIIRTWAFYTIAKAYLHEKKIPWKNIAVSGWILDPDRKKMSKSKGNVVTPMSYLEQYGGDSVRYWAGRARLGVDTAFDENLFKMGWKLTNKLFNACKFVFTQVENIQFKDHHNFDLNFVDSPIDTAWLYSLKELIRKSTEMFENFDYAGSLQITEEYFWKFCDHYMELTKARSYSQDEDSLSVKRTLDYSIHMFLRLFSPFFPYLCEELYSYRYKKNKKSVHLETWPSLHELSDLTTDDPNSFDFAIELISKIRSEKTKAQKKLKWPVSKLEIKVLKNYEETLKRTLRDLIQAGNIINLSNVSINSVNQLNDDEKFEMIVTLADRED